MIKPLTSLRFVFALMVFLSHMSFLVSDNNLAFKELYFRFFYEGYIGVGFFFMLSGFILSYTYKNALLSENVSNKEFYFKRLARIYPLHITTLLISIPIYLIEVGINTPIFTKQYLSNIFLLQSFGTDRSYFFSGNALSWSISNELFFYILFPFIILSFFHYRHFTRILLFVGCVIIILMIPQTKGGVDEHSFFYINPLTRLVDFALGIFLYDVYLFFKNKRIEHYASLLEILSVITIIIFIYFNPEMPQATRYSCYYWLPIFFLIFSFSFQKGIISILLSKNWFVILGEISFSFYMFHQLVIRYYTQLNIDFFEIQNPFFSMLIVFFASLGISYLSYYLIEKPANNFILKKLIRTS